MKTKTDNTATAAPMRTISELLCKMCIFSWVVAAALVMPVWWFLINLLASSTNYYEPVVRTAKPCPNDATLSCVYLGDELIVGYTTIRHRLNGNCQLKVWRYGEDIDGPTPGKRHLLDYAELQFKGDDDIHHPRWPVPPRKYVLGYDVNERIERQYDSPLLPTGVDTITMEFYNVAQYFCNPLDHLIPRYLQGGKPNETVRVRATVRRHKT